MAQIQLSPGTLPPPACYADEQTRFEAYVAAIVATMLGGTQWESSQTAPVDLALYWLRQTSDGRHKGPRKYNTTDARWLPWLEVPVLPDSSGGVANAYTATTGHSLVSAAVRLAGRRIVFTVAADNTGASTLDVDGTGAVAIKRHGGEDLIEGDLLTGMNAEVIYSSAGGGRWELQTPVPDVEIELPTYAATAEFAIPASASATEVSHSGGKVPFAVRVVAVCKTSINGYSVGEELDIGGIAADFNAGDEDGPAYLVSATASKINVAAATATNGQTYPARTGGNQDWGAASANFLFKAYLTFLPS